MVEQTRTQEHVPQLAVEGPEDFATIRSAHFNDIEMLNSIGISLYLTNFGEYWTEAGLRAFAEKQFDPDEIARDMETGSASFYIVESGGAAIGFAKTKPSQLLPGSKLTGTLLEKLYLQPTHTGKGIGQFVLAFLLEQAREKQTQLIWLDVLKPNHRAQRAYEKSGFRIVGEVPFDTDIQKIGFYVMALEL